jgi:hypothetical protein
MNFHPRRPLYVLDPEKAMSKQTVLYDTHQAMGARLVPFGGWEMPLHYLSLIHN